MSAPRRILLVRLSHLGDVLHALPVFHALRRAYPEARLAWAVQREFADLVQPLPGLARTLCFDRRGGLRAWVRLRREMLEFRPDWTVDAQGNLKSAMVSVLSAAGRRTGFHASDVRERGAAWALNDRAAPWPAGDARHAIDRNLHLAAHIAGTTAAQVLQALPEDWLQLRAVERTTGRKRWREHMGEHPARPLILQLAAPGDVRAWPVEHQLQLLRELDRRGRDVLVLSGPGEAQLGARVARELEGLGHLHHWVGQNSLRELTATLRAAGEAGATMVSCDSGPLHVAAASGLRCVVLAGPQDEERTGPWPPPGSPGSPHAVAAAREGLDCAPCFKRHCTQTNGVLCMERVTPAALLELLEHDPAAQ